MISHDVIPIPNVIQEFHKNVTLSVDVMHIKGYAVLVTTSQKYDYSTADFFLKRN